MAHYDVKEIVNNIERVLEEREADSLTPAEKDSAFRTARLEQHRRSVLRQLEREVLPRMRTHQSVDRLLPGTTMSLPKKVLNRVMRLFTARQASYNYNNIEAVVALAREVDALRDRLRMVEDGPLRPFAEARHETAEEKRLQNLVAQHLNSVQGNLSEVTGNVERIASAINQLMENLGAVTSRMNQMNVKQRDVYTEVTSARTDVSRLWTELGLVYESLDQRAEDIWHQIEERDVQLDMTTEATQSLHGEVGALESASRELRARLLTLAEQLTLQQEMLSTMQQELQSLGRAPRALAPAMGDPAAPSAVGAEGTLPVPAAAHESHFLPRAASQRDPMAEMAERQLDIAYLRFQRQYRGDEADLRRRQRIYVELLQAHLPPADEKPVILDVACGEGVFVELLREAGLDARGVDVNEAMVKQGVQRNLPIVQGDAIRFLEDSEPKTFNAISMFQFIEHLPPWELMRVLRASFRALRPGGLLLVETINPHTMMALRWFHLDISHQRLVYPEMLQLLSETAGFAAIEWKGLNTVRDETRLKVEGTETEKENLRKLNTFLFGEQDYYFLARRPGAA